jgi:hypothetical protein
MQSDFADEIVVAWQNLRYAVGRFPTKRELERNRSKTRPIFKDFFSLFALWRRCEEKNSDLHHWSNQNSSRLRGISNDFQPVSVKGLENFNECYPPLQNKFIAVKSFAICRNRIVTTPTKRSWPAMSEAKFWGFSHVFKFAGHSVVSSLFVSV